MSRISGTTAFFIASAMFAAGFAAGLLSSPASGRENRSKVRDTARGAGKWVNDQSKTVKSKAGEVNNQIRNTIKDQFPDLYEATGELSLTADEVLTGPDAR